MYYQNLKPFLFCIFFCACKNSGVPDKVKFTPKTPLANIPAWHVVDEAHRIHDIAWNVETNTGWAVGYRGAILEFTNGQWKKHEQGTAIAEKNSLNAISQMSGGAAWAVGEGIILQFANGNWVKHEEGSVVTEGNSMSALVVLSDGNAWAVGEEIILRLVNNEWTKHEQGSEIAARRDLYSLIAMPDGSAWAGGKGIILRYENDEWRTHDQGSAITGGKTIFGLAALKNGIVWGVGDGIICRYENGQWTKHEQDAIVRQNSLRDILALPDGSAWAVGYESVFRYENGQWSEFKQASALSSQKNIHAISSAHDGKIWAAGEGFFLRFENGRWETHQLDLAIAEGNDLYSVSSLYNDSAWAVGNDIILRYENGQWKKDQQGSAIASGLASITMLSDGSGWAVGYGIILRHGEGQWTKHEQGSALAHGVTLNAVSALPDGSAWAVGEGIILQFINGKWEVNEQGSALAGENDLRDISVLPDGSAWTVGGDIILQYNNGRWEKNKSGTALVARAKSNLYDLSMSPDGTGWAVGDGLILQCKNNVWKYHEQGTNLAIDDLLNAVSSCPDGSAWAVGREAIFYYADGEWKRDTKSADVVTENDIRDISVLPDGNAWAVGSYGMIYRTALNTMNKMSVDKPAHLFGLRDTLLFQFSQPVDLLQLSLSPADDTTRDFLKAIPDAYEITRQYDSAILITFSPNARKALELLAGKNAVFKIDAKTHPSFDIWQRFISTSFLVGEVPLWQKIARAAIITGISLIVLNIFFLVLAIPIPWFRRNVFGSHFGNLLALFSIKGVITKPLLAWIHPLKMAILSDYRRELAQRPDLRQWKDNTRSYTPPQIGNETKDNVIGKLWSDIESVAGRNDQKHIWMIQGRSGLGKTALIEQLCHHILANKKTPVILKPGSSRPEASLQKEFDYYGQLAVDEETAIDMVRNGGFCVLIDGLNEAKDPESVRLFIRSVVRTNIVLVTSQFDPDWPELVKYHIDLKPFGKQQLLLLLKNESLVDELMKADYLFDIYYSDNGNDKPPELRLLPFTATLIAEYIQKNNSIPQGRLALYGDLLQDLKNEPSYINFEKKAWEMFCDNSQNVEPDDKEDNIDRQFLEKAKDKGVLTTFVVKEEINYRFRHEKIFRFVVAAYLFRQKTSPDIDELHEHLSKSQDKLYWSDVFEYWGEFLSQELAGTKSGLAEYKSFLLRVGKFEPLILKKRLIAQWKRLCDKNPAVGDKEFNDQLIEILAREGKEI